MSAESYRAWCGLDPLPRGEVWTARVVRRSRGTVTGVLAELLGATCFEHRVMDYIAQRLTWPLSSCSRASILARLDFVARRWRYFEVGPQYGIWPGEWGEHIPGSRAKLLQWQAEEQEGKRARKAKRDAAALRKQLKAGAP